MDDPGSAELFDSGYTDRQLDRIFTSLAKGAKFSWPEEGLACALAIGLSDGDAVMLSERNTVMLTTPRAEIDRRVAAIRAKLNEGMTFQEAVDMICP